MQVIKESFPIPPGTKPPKIDRPPHLEAANPTAPIYIKTAPLTPTSTPATPKPKVQYSVAAPQQLHKFFRVVQPVRLVFKYPQETGFGDPLGEYAEGFNILQFINDSTPVDSPADPERNGFHEPSTHIPNQPNPNNNIIEGTWIHSQAPHQGQPNNNYCQLINTANGLMPNSVVVDNGVMYSTNGTRLQDSPPVTDISAGGSSASPSTTSDSPFSPDQYSNYMIPQNVIFGMQDGNGQILVSPDMANQQINGRIIPNHSPQSDFRSPYPAQSTPGSIISQVSPSAPPNQRFVMPQRPQQQQFPTDVYGSDISLNTMPSAKRKRVDLTQVKEEIPTNRMYPPPSARATPALSMMDDFDENVNHRPIRFSPHIPESWSDVFDVHHQPLRNISTTVIADKGFNYSAADSCFVNQKKNHFQITAQIEVHEDCGPIYFRNENGLKEITEFKMAFCGVKAEMPTSEISINQSQTDRKPIQHEPVSLQIQERRVTKVTVPRLHFSKTTDNNHRKNNRPNPEQRYFLLVVKLVAHSADGSSSLIRAYQSEKVIVRASNPAQFEQPDSDATWQRNGQLLSFNGPVAIGGDRILDNAQLSVLGNIVSTGSHTRPCDRRVKDNIIDVNKQEAMSRLSQFRIVEFDYKKEIANEWGLDETSRHRVGVVAQELAQVLPEAVRDNGEFLTVDDNRIFYETVAAAQELYRLTGNLECKIDQVEKISAKLARFSKNRHKLGLSEFSLFNRLEDSATLSGSTPSLVSTTTTCTERSTKNKQRRCRSNCARSDQTLCTSRVTQGTIVTLVIIMALCLLAMCSLYVVDWYNRTYVYSPHIPHITPSTNSQDIGHLIEQKYRLPLSWIPPTQPFAPILASMCDLMHQCPQYCCATTHKYATEGAVPVLDGFVPLKSSTMPKPATELLTHNTPPSPFKSKTSIDILNLNVSIDQRYCVENSCRPVNGRYNLYVPVSPFMPTIPLHIRFTVGDDKYVDNCGSLRDFAHKNCNFDFDSENSGMDRDPTSYMMGENTFELSVGNFAQSAYRFRVGFTTESCNMSEDQQGRSFDEYNIIFYRKCAVNGTIPV